MPPPLTSRPGWFYHPQRTRLRRALFQVHLWVGVVLALYSVVIGLTGSALVFRQEIENHLYPQRIHLTPRPATITLQQAVERIEAARPGWHITGLLGLSDPHRATTLLMARNGAPPTSNYRAIAFDRADGRVLADRMRFDGLLGTIANLHFYLLSGHTGLLVSGWMALGLLLLCLTGVILWWRGAQRWLEYLWLRLHRRHGRGINWRRLNWDLHSVVGFWSSALLLVVTFTGLYFCFPDAVRPLVLFATASHPAPEPRPPSKPGLPSSQSSPAARLSLDQVLSVARNALPANAPADYLFIPAQTSAPFSVTGYYTGAAPYAALVRLSLDPRTGEVLSREDTTHLTRGDRTIQSFFAIHFGSFAQGTRFNLAVKSLWALLGLVPALLAATGLILWWLRVLRPGWLRRQRRSAEPDSAAMEV